MSAKGDYTDVKAVVTGGTHGMGLAMARALLAGGAEVLVTGRNEGRVQAARAELGSAAAHVVRSDAAAMADVDAFGAQVAERFGAIDALFVNHGTAAFAPLEEVTEESYDRHFAVNTKGAFFTVQRLAPLMKDGGAIVFTTVANERIFPGMSAYSGAKEGVRGFLRVLAAEFLPRGVRVNAVAPGFIDTPSMGIGVVSAEQREEFMRDAHAMTPMGRPGSSEEVAAAAMFLAFDATFTTGAELPVDGGFAQGLPSVR
ncbi:SDR family oxidoreductase [Allonocardiopsis opalescens]|uniref:NAD(P)-dependent dehydrogenase (Short-subunit alcohol dehydrogenase family) n=1 Tax=Allonocardiopsis opalescens TaxID=1144618 RepID=A0A2T0Q2Y4_9ACTN|nr:SDR family oxidoreductase [Allonocardiopsis opalescens]PRX98154.1 NAD(P)-dependent dehydrogenase (short-subunit alcohol dehydrogenase family) [Allonocardiopsis opalescens]